MKKKLTVLLTIFLFIFCIATPISAQVSTNDAIQSTGQYMVKHVPNPGYGDEWFIVALARGGYKVPTNYYETYYSNLVSTVKTNKGILHTRKYTEYSRVILALSAIGKDAENVGGYNLVKKLYEYDQVVWQGLNGPIFALIALDTWQYKESEGLRDKYIQYILSEQLDDGGFSLAGTKADTDMTAMAIQALAPYAERVSVKDAINRAIRALSSLQQTSGGYGNAESVSQVITALTSVNINPEKDEKFNKTLNQLLNFYDPQTGGFKHLITEKAANPMATEQAGYALVAYNRLIAGKTALYQMSDTKQKTTKQFTDTSSHWAKEYIEAATSRGMLKGYENGTFKPNKELTRVQAVSILARALRLENKGEVPFSDLDKYDQSTKDEVAAAAEAGLLITRSGKFSPSEKLPREELAVMLLRAYSYKTGESYVPEQMAPLKDIQNLSKEAQQAITFLYNHEIAQGSNGAFNPAGTTTRAHAAKMFVNFLLVVE